MSNEITGGGPLVKESTFQIDETQVRVIKREDEPSGILRISLGGVRKIGFYLVYRGDLDKIKALMKTCWLALEKFDEK